MEWMSHTHTCLSDVGLVTEPLSVCLSVCLPVSLSVVFQRTCQRDFSNLLAKQSAKSPSARTSTLMNLTSRSPGAMMARASPPFFFNSSRSASDIFDGKITVIPKLLSPWCPVRSRPVRTRRSGARFRFLRSRESLFLMLYWLILVTAC